MKTYRVVLTKSYLVDIQANNEDEAKFISELFTGNIREISKKEDRLKFHFKVLNIESVINEAFECEEINV
jgi:hypothetical protein